MADEIKVTGETRRDVIRKMAFVAPAVLTLAAAPSFASVGSDTKLPAPSTK